MIILKKKIQFYFKRFFQILFLLIYGEIKYKSNVIASKNIENPGKIFIGNNFVLIGEKNKGIHVFDNSSPSNPVNVAFIQLPFSKEFYVENNIVKVFLCID